MHQFSYKNQQCGAVKMNHLHLREMNSADGEKLENHSSLFAMTESHKDHNLKLTASVTFDYLDNMLSNNPQRTI